MISQPSNFAHVVLTRSQGRSAIADWQGCDRGDPRRVTDCLKQYPSPLSVETICGVNARSRDKASYSSPLLQMSESKKKKPEDPQMELTWHVSRLCMHIDIYEKFEISRTVGPRRTPGTVAAERTDHFIDEPTQWFLDRCPGEVNITPRFQSQISSQRWPNLVVKV